jgi:hypothetical protein
MQHHRPRVLERFSSFWWGDKGLSAQLALLTFAFLFAPLLDSAVGQVLSSAFFSLFILSGVATISDKRRHRIGAGIVAFITFLLTWLEHVFPDNTPLLTAAAAATFCYMVLLTGVVLWHVFKDGTITTSRVLGAIVAYVLIGLTWAGLYQLVDLIIPGSMSVSTAVGEQNAFQREKDFIYFSFVTLTTTGYGDITPLLPTARVFMIIEALIGQLFPATLLARLVSLQGVRREPDGDA